MTDQLKLHPSAPAQTQKTQLSYFHLNLGRKKPNLEPREKLKINDLDNPIKQYYYPAQKKITEDQLSIVANSC